MFGMPTNALRAAAVVAAAAAGGLGAHAKLVEITVQNVTPAGGLWSSPLFFGFHDGAFDPFDLGAPASAAIEAIAEAGDASGLVAELGNAFGRQSFVLKGGPADSAPPVALFAPGESNSFVIDLDAMANRYLTFGSMIVPSNDAFIMNDSPTAHALFNLGGAFNSGFEINIFGGELWDSGTEENNGLGAAFSTLGPGEIETINGLVSHHPGLGLFVGTLLPIGEDLLHAFDDMTPLIRITARELTPVPEPSAIAFAGGGAAILALAILKRRRRPATAVS